MNKLIKKILCITLFFAIIIFTKINAFSEIDREKVIKVGYYDIYPYYFTNSKGEVDGYFHEIMNGISNKLNIKYEYINIEDDKALERINNREIDLLFGVPWSTELLKNYVYNKYYLHNEILSIYGNKDMKYGILESLSGKNLGYIEWFGSSNLAINILKEKNVNVNLVKKKSAEKLIQELKEGNLDAIIHISDNKELSDYNELFRIFSGPVYIIALKENEELIKEIDLLFEKSEDGELSSIIKLHNKYFNEYFGLNQKIGISFLVIVILMGIIICYSIYKKYSRHKRISSKKKSIVSNLRNGSYLLYYQPIVDPKSSIIKGFEALLRLKENGKIVPPVEFLKDIEETNMMSEVSLWIFKKVIKDYFVIKTYSCIGNRQFYISINLSFNEFENDKFIEQMRELLTHSTLSSNSICLEIVERFAIKDLAKVQDAIDKLKNVGFMVAIDDFGVEYSNLDVLEKVKCDIIKLDKYFIDEIEASSVRRSVVEFVSNMCKATNKTVVCEGVETEIQKNFIENIDNDKFYIQGYYYSKPISIEELEDFNI